MPSVIYFMNYKKAPIHKDIKKKDATFLSDKFVTIYILNVYIFLTDLENFLKTMSQFVDKE